MSEMDRSVYTLGTSTRTFTEFVALLKSVRVERVMDVRRFPGSRFQHFKREEMAKSLPHEGIGYSYLGQELGGYRAGGYEAFLASKEFERGLEMLEEIALERNSAIICAERLPWRCHRRFIGAELAKRGWQVVHIIDEKRVWSPGS